MTNYASAFQGQSVAVMAVHPGVGGEGYVHINGGIHGIGDLAPATYD